MGPSSERDSLPTEFSKRSKTEIMLILIIIIMALLVSYCLGLQWALVSLLHSFYPLVLVHHSSKVSDDSCEIMS